MGFSFRRQKIETASAPVQSIANGDEQRSLADPAAWLFDLLGAAPVNSGVTVTPATAMRCAPVRAAVEAICEAVGGLPLHLYERGASGARSRATGHPVYALLHGEANGWTPAALFREQLTRDALLHGNGFAHVGRDGAGTPRELIRLDPATVTVQQDRTTGEPVYRLTGTSTGRFLDRRDVLHIAAPSTNGFSGASPVLECREAIGLCLALERHAGNLFRQGGRPSGLLSFPSKIGADTAARMKASWQAATAGGNSGGTAILEEGGGFTPLAFSSVDAQFLEIWGHAVTEIARVFRVPPHLLFDLGRATWGNASEMGATFLRFTLDRWLKCWTGEIRLKLLLPDERQTVYTEFLVDDLLRSDLSARAAAYSQLIAARVLNPNEVRQMENRAPYDGGDAFLNPHTTTAAQGGAS
ncbi:phage portal protein [Frigidibacter oleivorans]|uniref:phage portal protein n=1 Tax=Frigidibacter oleivorans TaxID=2487129 RepID=UPI000F8F447E|nr:phage portal protein [Frigidibacter oleivorans]